MAKKLPLVPIGIAAGAGIATYFAATQLSQRVAFMQQHPIAAPATLAAIGVLVAKKHLPIGLGIAGAAGAIGYLQYKAGATAQPQPSTVQPQTVPATYQPATTQPTTQPGTASTPGGTSDTGQQVSNIVDQLSGGGDQSGTTTGAGTGTDGSTGTAGYSAGKLLSGPHMHSHLKKWSRGGAGALLSGPRPASHLAPWHRNAGHYDAPAPGEAGGLRGGAYGLSSD
jgi:hypothetical protein